METNDTVNDGFCFSQEVDKIFPAFISFQSNLTTALKSSKNPFFNSKYADLTSVWDAIKVPLSDNKLGLMQFVYPIEYKSVLVQHKTLKTMKSSNGSYEKLIWNGEYDSVDVREILITTFLLHDSTQWVKSCYIVTPEDNTDQSRGKSITYGKRYSLASLCGVVGEDEDTDGNPVNVCGKKEPKPTVPKPTAAKLDKFIEVGGVKRFNSTKRLLVDEYQEKNNLISQKEWGDIRELIKSNLGGSADKFNSWLKHFYGVVFYDIKKDDVGSIILALVETPSIIMESNSEPS